MAKKIDIEMGTQPVRIDTGILSIVRNIKEKIGIPIQRFVEDAIVEKVGRMPTPQKAKIGLVPKKTKRSLT